MFHEWKPPQYTPPEHGEVNPNAGAKRRISTARACEPCRRRKIRCNGEHPCESCQWYRKAASCYYTEPRQRLLYKRSADKGPATLQDYRDIVQKLFSATPPDQLTELSRDSLVELIAKNSPMQQQQPPSPITSGLDEKAPVVNADMANLEQLQPMPEEDTDGTDSRLSDIQDITDDVNALSLSVKKSSSYLGISSVMAALRVILWLDPEAQTFFAKTPDRSHVASRMGASPPSPHATPRAESSSSSSSPWAEIPLINAYFDYIHPFNPLIDESAFRETYLSQSRADSRWLLLLNTVLALGGMAAAPSCEDLSHHVYWARVKQHLTIETLGSVHLETVQALALLGGFYLHYINKPHVANALMGATLRLATALGLHRDYSEGLNPNTTEKAKYTIEARRRVWWNLFIMDAWHGSSLGRPSMGRMNHAISAKPPHEPIGGSQSLLAIVQENIRFCIISTKMENALALSPLIPEAERKALDEAFVDWFRTSNVQNKTPRGPLGELAGITISKNVMRWRYLLWRIIIHRPVLLWYAMRRMPFQNLPPDKKAAIELCRELAGELIGDIAGTWQGQKACQMAGWNATWNLYQTLMVPLLSLFSDPGDGTVLMESRAQVEQGLKALSDLRYWSNIARRSYQVVNRIYEASRRHEQPTASGDRVGEMESVRPTYIDTTFATLQGDNNAPTTASQEMLFDSLNWSTGWGEEYPFETLGSGGGWDFNAMSGTGYSGSGSFDQNFAPVFMEGDGGMGDYEGGEGFGRAWST